MTPTFFIKFFFLLFSLLVASSSKAPRMDDLNEIEILPSKRQRTGEVNSCVICNTQNGHRTIQLCTCPTLVHDFCLVKWFKDNSSSMEYHCSDCGATLKLADLLTGNWSNDDGEKSRKFQGLKAFVTLNLPINSLELSDDQLTATILTERNGVPLSFTISSNEIAMNGQKNKKIIDSIFKLASTVENFNLVKYITDNYIDINTENPIFEETLRFFIKFNVYPPIKFLFDLGMKKSLTSTTYDSLLLQAFNENNIEIFCFLLKSENPPRLIEFEGKSLLKMAIEKNSQIFIAQLIQRSIIPDDVTGPITNLDDQTIKDMLKNIFVEDNVHGIKNVLKLQVPFASIKFISCFSLLEIAITKSREMFETFLLSGLTFTEDKATEKIRCYYRAIETDKADNLELFSDFNINYAKSNGNTVLQQAITFSNIKVIECAIKLGADVNQHSQLTGYPLIHAVRRNNYNVVLALLKAGANLKLVDKNGINALTICLKYGLIETLKAIIEFTKKIQFWDHDGFNTLHIAILHRQIPTAEFLINQGMTAIKIDGTTTWMISKLASIDSSKMLEYLFEKCGANVYEENIMEGLSPMIISIVKNKTKNVEAFLKHGYDPNKRIEHGTSTLLHYTVKMWRFDIANLLIKYGADTNALDKDGRTAFSYVQDKEIIDKSKKLDEFL